MRVSWPTERVLALHVAGLKAGGAVGVFHDVTTRKRLEESRPRLVANVSHELQTPLSTLAGYGEALGGSIGDPERVGEIAEVIRRQSGRMSALVQNLLELSRLESEGFVPASERVEIEALAREVVDAWEGRALEQGLSLILRVDSGLFIQADRGLLHQALTNLVENAVRYVPQEGEIEVGAHARPEAIELFVHDTGEGSRARISRGSSSGSTVSRKAGPAPWRDGPGARDRQAHRRGSSGVGGVDSAPGRGSTFRVILPDMDRSFPAGAYSCGMIPQRARRACAGAHLTAQDCREPVKHRSIRNSILAGDSPEKPQRPFRTHTLKVNMRLSAFGRPGDRRLRPPYSA